MLTKHAGKSPVDLQEAGSAGRKAKPTRLKTAEFSTGSMRTSTSVSIAGGLVHHGAREFRRASTQKEGADRSAGQVEGGCGCQELLASALVVSGSGDGFFKLSRKRVVGRSKVTSIICADYAAF